MEGSGIFLELLELFFLSLNLKPKQSLNFLKNPTVLESLEKQIFNPVFVFKRGPDSTYTATASFIES